MEALLSIAGSILGSLASKVAEYTVDPIPQQLSYLFKHRSKFQNLKTKVDQLKDARERVQQSVLNANRNGEDIFPDVDRWLTVTNEKISEQAATQLQEDEENANHRCFAGFCPNFKSRYQLSKKAEKEVNTIAELLNQKDRFDGVSHCPTLEGIGLRPVKEYEAFESRSGALNGVMEALKDDNCNIIGVYGMGGVGKTTLVKEVARQAKEKQLFDEVVFVAITQTPNPENIQNEIAEKLGQKFDVVSIDVRAARLRDRLKKDKKVLIILDDIWVTLESYKLGIPSRDEHMGCKILMTSRKLDVLQSMDSQKNIAIDILKDDEAWNLFKNMVGDIVERSDFQSTAIEVSQKCAGLPIAIATVAKALKHKDWFGWKSALEQLKRPSEINFRGIPGAVYSAIELSYKFLEAEELQLTFLLCSIMGHNAAIEDLLRYGMGLGLFRDVYTMEETRDKVLTLVSNLKASSLLLAGSTPKHFDMHDVVCDVAISIASRDRHWLALREEDVFEEWSDEETMRNCNLISLQYAKVSELPLELECPNLTFFFMGSEGSSLEIPSNFFKRMQRLKVLEFTEMHFSSLPLSMGSLKNIHTLCLSKCMLKDIVVIGELRNLEILNLRKSDITMLPREIGHLTKLKLLDLSDCHDLEVISPNVLSNLSRLEELYLYDSFDGWVVEGIDDPRSNASLVELQHLFHLTTLEVHIPNEQAMSKDYLFSKRLERYKISIGDKWLTSDRSETSRMLKLKINNSIHLYDEVKPLLRNTEYLYLNEGGIQSIASLLFDQKVVFLTIKVLYLDSINVVELWHDQFSVKSFGVGNLTSLEVWNCHNLKYLFPSSMVQSFDQLKILVVSYCNEIEEVIGGILGEEEMISSSMMVFPKLHYLRLYNLSKLKRFCSGSNQIQFPFLKELEIGACPVLSTFHYDSTSVEKNSSILMDHNLRTDVSISHYLFNQKVVFPTLKQLRLHSISSIEKLWHDQVPIMSFGIQNLTKLEVWGCCKLKYVFTSSMIKSLVQLRRLFVEGCDEMEEVIEGILEEEMISSISVFPKLYYLYLYMLPNLKRFCSGIYPIQFPFLTELTIRECPVLSTFYCDSISVGKNSSISMDYNLRTNVPIPHYLFNEKVLFPIIEELTLHLISGIEKLWYDQLPIMSFKVQNLTSLEVRYCHNLKYVFTSSMIKYLVQLKTLVVSNCDEIEEVIAVTEGILEENTTSIMVFPKLHYMNLKNLPNLKRFFSGINPIEFPFLRELTVWGCPVLSTFNETRKSKDHNLRTDPPQYHLFNEEVSLPMLEHLQINYTENLEGLWSNQLAEDSLPKLISFDLGYCDKLRHVFPLSMLTRLQKLDKLTIRNCELLEEIFESQQEGSSVIQSLSPQPIQSVMESVSPKIFEFPRVTSLRLKSLPKLKSFYYKIHATNWPSLKEMEVIECDKLEILFASQESSEKGQHEIPIQKPLFWVKTAVPTIEESILYLNNIERLWHDQLPVMSCGVKNLISLEVRHCHNLKNLFTFTIVRSFVQLKSLLVEDCEEIEEVIAEERIKKMVFPKLDYLELKRLPSLKRFCSGNPIEFPLLKVLKIASCPVFTTFHCDSSRSGNSSSSISMKNTNIPKYLFNEKVALPMLKELYVSDMENLQGLWPDHHDVGFQHLTLTDSRKEKEIIEGGGDKDEVKHEISFPQLNRSEFLELPKLESSHSLENYTFRFPSLKFVFVQDCPKMKKFSQGESNTQILQKV